MVRRHPVSLCFILMMMGTVNSFVPSNIIPSRRRVLFAGITRKTALFSLVEGRHHKAVLEEVSPPTTNNDQVVASSYAKNPSEAFGSPISSELNDFNLSTVTTMKHLLFDVAFAGKDRDYARFYALETIARMPYFSYLSVLHLYETLGWWRKANYLKIHFAESWNELHHLLIMEELGGSDRWTDRFLAQHASVAYYWIVVALYMFNPTLAYNFNEHVEQHAFETYDTFLNENEERLKQLPAPSVAKSYYRDGDLYMFDEMQTQSCEPRRPVMDTLYDAFVAIRDDEAQHVKTMSSLQIGSELINANDDTCDVSEASSPPPPLSTRQQDGRGIIETIS